jgi:hypothetical protein
MKDENRVHQVKAFLQSKSYKVPSPGYAFCFCYFYFVVLVFDNLQLYFYYYKLSFPLVFQKKRTFLLKEHI